ncbi:hypothetical protein MHYP_G00087230 [Metynnis hypsauchen]
MQTPPKIPARTTTMPAQPALTSSERPISQDLHKAPHNPEQHFITQQGHQHIRTSTAAMQMPSEEHLPLKTWEQSQQRNKQERKRTPAALSQSGSSMVEHEGSLWGDLPSAHLLETVQ